MPVMRRFGPAEFTGNIPNSYHDQRSIDHIRGCGTRISRSMKKCSNQFLAINWGGHRWSRGIISFRSTRGIRRRARGRVHSEYGVLGTINNIIVTYVAITRCFISHENLRIAGSLTCSARTWRNDFVIPGSCPANLQPYVCRVTLARTRAV
jgi:hypothetical protein